MADSIRWRVFDRQGNQIYLTEERWQHIIETDGHPEMADYEEELKETIRQGRRRQIPLQPQKYEYSKVYHHLVDNNTHMIALVLFRVRENERGRPVANNYIVTAYQKEIG
jgi:Na+/phosphate symporter